MSDNPRGPGHPSDMPSSRQTDRSFNSSSSAQHSGAGSPSPSSTQPANNQVKNIIIGSIATIIASTSVYYLTQYVNNKKSSDAEPSFLVKKDATVSAWKRYVTTDNLYYKSVVTIQNDTTLTNHPDNFKKEILNESGIFKRDTEKLAKDNNIDPLLKAMLNRRLERQTEYEGIISILCDKLVSIINSKDSVSQKEKLALQVGNEFLNNSKRMYIKGVAEIKDLSQTLSQTYAQEFNPMEILVYKDYMNIDDEEDEPLKQNNKPISDADSKNLVGDWDDNGNAISFKQNGSMSYSRNNGEKATGTWKIENNQLRVDILTTNNNDKGTWFFNISKLSPDSFTMNLTVEPFETYNLLRVKK